MVNTPADVTVSWGGLQPVSVHSKPNLELGEFCWDSSFTRLSVSIPFEKLLKWIGKSESDYYFEFLGYRAYECTNPNCGVKKVYHPMARAGSCHPYTSNKHVARVSSRVIDRIEFLERVGRADYVNHVVLTAPGWVSEWLPDHDTIAKFQRCVAEFIKMLSDELFGWGACPICHREYRPGTKFCRHHNIRLERRKSLLGCWYAVHLWSSMNPLHKHLHAHLILPNVAYGETGFYRCRPLLEKEKLRKIWRDVLKRHGFWDSPCESDLPDVFPEYVRIRVPPKAIRDHLLDRARELAGVPPGYPIGNLQDYLRDRVMKFYSMLTKKLRKSDPNLFTDLNPKLVHLVRYAFRLPIVDLNEHLESWQLGGADKKFAKFLVDYTTRCHRAGFPSSFTKEVITLSDGSEIVHRIGILKSEGFVCRKTVVARCPLCSQVLVYLGKVKSNLPDLPHYYRARNGEWLKTDPPPPLDNDSTTLIGPPPQREPSIRSPGRGRHPGDDQFVTVSWGDN